MDNNLRRLSDAGIRNLVLFVGDAVRHDAAIGRLSGMGPSFKTISASLHTPASFASMFTGLNVPEHGVVGFSSILDDDIPSLVKVPRMNAYFSSKTGTMHEDMHRIFQMPTEGRLADAEEPFVWVVRDPGGHAPYDGYDEETYDQLSETGPEYLHRVAGDHEQIQSDYEASVTASIDRFKEAVRTVRTRGIQDETVLIYTSDHGELLGEYGMLGHNHVACPELVYTPTTFVHPSLGDGERNQTMRHIDLFPTILEILDCVDLDTRQLSGNPVWDGNNEIGYNHFEMVFYNSDLLSDVSTEVRSCWDGDGGHVFVESSYKDALLLYLGLLWKSHKGVQIRKDNAYTQALSQLLPGHKKYGEPCFERTRAEEYIEAIHSRSVSTQMTELDADTKERLDDLGYL